MEIGHRFLEKTFGSDAIRDRRNNCEQERQRDFRKENSTSTRGTTVKSERHQFLRTEPNPPERQRSFKIDRK